MGPGRPGSRCSQSRSPGSNDLPAASKRPVFDLSRMKHSTDGPRPDTARQSHVEPVLHGLIRPGQKWGNEKIARLLSSMGSPEKALPWLQVVGTCGKGSTAAALASCLRARGLRVGLFTSPHLESPRERIQVDGEPIRFDRLQAQMARLEAAARIVEPNVEWPRMDDAVEDVSRPVRSVAAAAVEPPSFFESMFCLACSHFRDEGVQIAVAEAGIGGGRDVTALLDPKIVVLTSLGMDHTDLFGPTVEDVAREKCRVAKPGVPFLSAVADEAVRKIVDRETGARGAMVHHLDAETRLSIETVGIDGTLLELGMGDRGSVRLKTNLIGRHQARNAALAAWGLRFLPEDLRPDAAQVATGMAQVRWPARFQYLPASPKGSPSRFCVWDAGHNPDGVEATVRAFLELFPGVRPTVLAGFSRDKDLGRMIDQLACLSDRPVFTTSRHWKAAVPRELVRIWTQEGRRNGARASEDPRAALAQAWSEAALSGALVIVGSIYLIGDLIPTARDLGIPAPAFLPAI